jgi:hypothetical protein
MDIYTMDDDHVVPSVWSYYICITKTPLFLRQYPTIYLHTHILVDIMSDKFYRITQLDKCIQINW